MPPGLICVQCGKSFAHRRSLVRHSKEAHGSAAPPLCDSSLREKKMTCGSCGQRFLNNVDFKRHLSEDHDVLVVSEKLSFASKDEFVDWKRCIEEKTAAKFVVRDTRKNKDDTSVTYYRCNRDGFYKACVDDSSRKRELKAQGSRKINAHCPARMLVSTSRNGVVNVEFDSTHHSHDTQLAHVPISTPTNRKIAACLASKMPFETVLEEVSKLTGEVDRDSLSTKEDLWSIIRRFGLDVEYKLHSDDATSLDVWVENERKKSKQKPKTAQATVETHGEADDDGSNEEPCDESCVIVYKGKGVNDPENPTLRDEDFLLGIMTTGQRDMLTRFGHNIITIDSTRGTNSCGYQLTILTVIDDLGQGFPCAFSISDRNDRTSVEVFLRQVKRIVGKLSCQVLMTDVAKTFYNGWTAVMGNPDRHLYCTWHVLRAWENKIHRVIKSPAKKKETSAKVRALLTETDFMNFEKILPVMIDQLIEDKDTKKFGEYFRKYFSRNSKKWAYCYRLMPDINADMHLEKMHRDLKLIFLKGINVERLDKTIHALMQLTNSKLLDRLIALEKGKLSSKLKALRLRHKAASLIANRVIIVGSGDAADSWTVPSGSALDSHTVSLNQAQCTACQLVCRHCNACIHEYSCTCIDYAVKFNMCKHVHLVAQLNLTPLNFVAENSEEVEMNTVEEARAPLVIHEASTAEGNKMVTVLRSNGGCSAMKDMKLAIAEKINIALNECSTVEKARALLDSIDTALLKMRALEGQTSSSVQEKLAFAKNVADSANSP